MRLLIIEDEPDLLDALTKALIEEGYAVDTASDGEDALFKALSWEYDVIILDLMIPIIDGWELLKELRKKKATPVLILTARAALDDRIRGLDVGADDYLVKPFELGELKARVRALVRRNAGQATNVIDLGNVRVDLARRIVEKNGKIIALTSREYSLIEYLALHRGRLVTRTELYDHLYGEQDDTLSNVLDVHVSKVRKKLGRELIVTRRGQGYQINV